MHDTPSLARRALPVVVAGAALAAFPLVGGTFAVDLVNKIMILAIFALSLELLVGRTGLVSMGHAGFFGMAAYAAALAAPAAEPASLPLLMALSVGAASAFALLAGALSLRTKGVYFIMVTLAFGQMAYHLFHDTPLGGGSDGIYLNLRPEWRLGETLLLNLDAPRAFYWFTFAMLAATFALLALVGRSRFGHALAGIRVNEQRMRASGFPTYPYKLGAFVLAGMLAGVAGFLYAVKDGYVNPEILSWHHSGAVLVMIILGGLGSLRGAVLGAFVFTLLQETFQNAAWFGALAKHWQLSLGLTVIAFVALLPRGLVGTGALLARREPAVTSVPAPAKPAGAARHA